MKALSLPTVPRGRLFRLCAGVLAAVALSPALADRSSYDVDYTIGFLPDEGQAQVIIAVTPGDGQLREVKFDMPATRYSDLSGDGTITRKGDAVTWRPAGSRISKLRYRYLVNDKRPGGGYDARITDDWAIVRGDDLVPAQSVRTTRDADSRARLHFVLPKGWSNADTPYVRSSRGNDFVVVNPERSFDRPVGWVIAGDVGTRREDLEGVHISVAGPKSGDVRRLDMLSFFNGLVPEFHKAFGKLPSKLLIVSAGDPMWRGGLSGPRSLFLHADRPLISENGTSTLTHELTHVITRIRGADGDDWIAEGLAEYYSIELLRRAGLLSEARADRAHDWMRDYGKKVKTLTSDRSRGPRTARAVQLFAALDKEIRTRTKGKRSLDDVVRALMPVREVSREDLREQVEELTGAPSKVLATPLLD
jgi:predicted metalloprotease with PDZ domain